MSFRRLSALIVCLFWTNSNLIAQGYPGVLPAPPPGNAQGVLPAPAPSVSAALLGTCDDKTRNEVFLVDALLRVFRYGSSPNYGYGQAVRDPSGQNFLRMPATIPRLTLTLSPGING